MEKKKSNSTIHYTIRIRIRIRIDPLIDYRSTVYLHGTDSQLFIYLPSCD